MSEARSAPNLKELIGKAITSAQQEMMLTLPNRLVLAFAHKEHEKDIDPATQQPFTSFYRWLWTMPPPGCGLCNSRYLDAEDIIRQLEKSRDRLPDSERTIINGLIEDLVKGHGAAKKRGGDRKSEKAKTDQSNGTVALIGQAVRKKSAAADSLAARLAESSEPRIRKAWQGYLEGKHKSVTAAAIACGMIEDSNAPLARLKQNWKKATATERLAFLAWIKETPT